MKTIVTIFHHLPSIFSIQLRVSQELTSGKGDKMVFWKIYDVFVTSAEVVQLSPNDIYCDIYDFVKFEAIYSD